MVAVVVAVVVMVVVLVVLVLFYMFYHCFKKMHEGLGFIMLYVPDTCSCVRGWG